MSMRIRPHDVPASAVGRTFLPKGKKGGDYWIWKKAVNSYYWSACGNNGEAETFDEAAELARRWIRGDK